MFIEAGATTNYIGTDGSGSGDGHEGNVISGNTEDGVRITGSGTNSNVVAGNWIGTNEWGDDAVPNGEQGVLISGGAKFNRIGTDGNGTSDAAESNLISGNWENGVRIAGSGTDKNIVAGNLIGTNETADDWIPNDQSGVVIRDGARENRIGIPHEGTAVAAQANVISGNNFHGVAIYGGSTDWNIVSGNYIGTNKTKDAELQNEDHGVYVEGGNSTWIGSNGDDNRDVLEGNTIWHNVKKGVVIKSGFDNRMLTNSIYDNGDIGIDLHDDGFTPNDTKDVDTGANNKQNYAVIGGVVHKAGNTIIYGSLHSTPLSDFHVELFGNDPADTEWYQGGKEFLRSVDPPTTDVNGDTSFKVTVLGKTLTNITATATPVFDGYYYETSEFGSFGLDLDVDTNRDKDLTQADEEGEDQWIPTGANRKGAIILYNGDDDNGDDIPDNWFGGDLDGDGTDDAKDTTVNGATDVTDIGELWLYKTGVNSLPLGATITMKIERVTGEDAYWTNAAKHAHDTVQERVRIFLPNLPDGDDLKIQDGNGEIIGPTEGVSITFRNNPGNPDHFGIFEGAGIVKFGIEGLYPGAPVMITTKFELGGNVIATDKVQIKVSPLVFFSHNQNVDTDGTPTKTVYVSDMGAGAGGNADLRADLNTVFPGVVEEVGGPPPDDWWQDPYEIGYVKSPYAEMHVNLMMSRGKRAGGYFNDYAINTMMKDQVGILPDFAYNAGWNNQTDGGNFEVQPGVGRPLGTIIMGENAGAFKGKMDQKIVSFLRAQGVQNVVDTLDLKWMRLGHTDEVVSFGTAAAADAKRARIASPQAAWALLMIAKDAYGKGGELMLPGMEPHLGAGVTVNDILTNALLRTVNFGAAGANTSMDGVMGTLGLTGPVSNYESKAGAPAGVLGRAGYLDGYDTLYTYGDQIQWKLTFTGANAYDIHRKSGGGGWVADGSGNRTADSFSTSKVVYILRNWWGAAATAAGQEVWFKTRPSPNMIEMPVLFWNSSGALAYTNNLVNSIVQGNKIIMSEPHGPDVGGGIGDIYNWYAEKAAGKVGFTTVEFSEERIYHNGVGSIHCGTNVMREIGGKWWNDL